MLFSVEGQIIKAKSLHDSVQKKNGVNFVILDYTDDEMTYMIGDETHMAYRLKYDGLARLLKDVLLDGRMK